jgi:glucokinase
MSRGGIDLGGTKIEAGVTDDEDQVLGRARQRHRRMAPSAIWQEALEQHDALAERVIERAIRALGAGPASAINLIDVEAAVIGGGLGTRLGETSTERIRQAMLPHLFVSNRPPDVRLSELGDVGGAIGAARLVPIR